MEYCCPLWAGSLSSHLAQLDARKRRPLRLLESTMMNLSQWVYHFTIADRSVASLSSTDSFLVLHTLLFPCFVPAPSPHQVSAGLAWSTIDPILVKLPKSQITINLHSFVALFSCLWNQFPHPLQSHSSHHFFKTAVHHHVMPFPIQHHDLLYPR